MQEMKKLILGSYGVKSTDGKRFIKNDQLRSDFESSEAYSTFFMELVTDADAASAFITGIMPKDLIDETEKVLAQNNEGVTQSPMGGVRPPEEQVQARTITREEFMNLSTSDFEMAQAELRAGSLKILE
jgi:hypothetical protein